MKLKLRKSTRLIIFGTLGSFIMTFLTYTWLEKRKNLDEFLFQKTVKNFEEGAEILENTTRSYDSIMFYMSDNQGLTRNNLKPFIDKIRKQTYEFKYYTERVAMFGSEEQISVTKTIDDYLFSGWNELNLHDYNSEYLEKQIIKINKRQFKDSLQVEQMYSKLDDIMYNENKLYFNFRENYLPILENLKIQYVGIFRGEIGLEITSNIKKSNIDLAGQIAKRDTFKFENNNLQYRFSKVRSLSSYNLDMPNDSILLWLNEMDRRDMFAKFIIEAMEFEKNEGIY